MVLSIWANDVLDGAELCQLGLGLGIERSRGENPNAASLQPDCGGATAECEGTASERPELNVSGSQGYVAEKTYLEKVQTPGVTSRMVVSDAMAGMRGY